MFCFKCGNEILLNEKFCGNCGYEAIEIPKNQSQEIILKDVQNKSYNSSILEFIYKGDWFAIDYSVEVFVNNILILKSTFKKGFNFKIENSEKVQEIKIKFFIWKTNTIDLPPLNKNKSYRIELEFSRIWGCFCSKPKLITEI